MGNNYICTFLMLSFQFTASRTIPNFKSSSTYLDDDFYFIEDVVAVDASATGVNFDIFNGPNSYCLVINSEKSGRIGWTFKQTSKENIKVGLIISNMTYELYTIQKNKVTQIEKFSTDFLLDRGTDYLILKNDIKIQKNMQLYIHTSFGFFVSSEILFMNDISNCEHLSTIKYSDNGSVSCLNRIKYCGYYEFQSLTNPYLTITTRTPVLDDKIITTENFFWKCRAINYLCKSESELRKIQQKEINDKYNLTLSFYFIMFSFILFLVSSVIRKYTMVLKRKIKRYIKIIKRIKPFGHHSKGYYVKKYTTEINWTDSDVSLEPESSLVSTILDRGRIRLESPFPSFENCIDYYTQKKVDRDLLMARVQYSRTYKMTINIGVPESICVKMLMRDENGLLKGTCDENYAPKGDQDRSTEVLMLTREIDCSAPMFYFINQDFITCLRKERLKCGSRGEPNNKFFVCSEMYAMYGAEYLLLLDPQDCIDDQERHIIAKQILSDETYEYFEQKMPNELVVDGVKITQELTKCILIKYVLCNYKSFIQPVYIEEYLDVVVGDYFTVTYSIWIVETSSVKIEYDLN